MSALYTHARLVYRNNRGQKKTAKANTVIDDYNPVEAEGWIKRAIVSEATKEQLAIAAHNKQSVKQSIIVNEPDEYEFDEENEGQKESAPEKSKTRTRTRKA